MKLLGQAAAVGVYMVLVGGIAFISQWVTTETMPPPAIIARGTEKSSNYKLNFPVTQEDSRLISEIQPAKGLFYFWFENKNAVHLEMLLYFASCQCARTEVTYLTSEEEMVLRDFLPRAVATQTTLASAGFLPTLGSAVYTTDRVQSFLGQPDRWTTLIPKHNASQSQEVEGKQQVIVPPRTTGLMRTSWEGKTVKRERLKLKIWSQEPGAAVEETTLELRLNFVRAVKIEQEEIDLGMMASGDRKTFQLPCWSHTRAGFDLKPVLEKKDGAFTCTSRPMTVDECRALGQNVEAPVLSGHVLTVTADSHKLDLGQFRRTLSLDSEALLEPMTVTFTGTVRGAVRILAAENDDRIHLRAFPAGKGESREVLLEADQPDMQLEFHAKTPDFLGVELSTGRLTGDGKKQWTLKVTVPPNRASGPLPVDCAIELKTRGVPPRFIRIPVTGRAVVDRK